MVNLVTKIARVATAEVRAYDMKDDLVQELFVALPEALEKWDEEKGSIDAFIFGYARNILRTMIRKQSDLVFQEETGETEDNQEMVYYAFQADSQTDVEDKIDMENAMKRVMDKLAKHDISIEDLNRAVAPKRDQKPQTAINNDAKILETIIARSGLSKAAVARFIGISPQLLNAYLKGKTRTVPRHVIEALLELEQQRTTNEPSEART